MTDRLSELEHEVRDAFCFTQPCLAVRVAKDRVIAEGTYFLNGAKSSMRDGPLAEYEIRLEIYPDYPDTEPRVFETNGRIPKGRHLNPDGTCCTGVWEEWLSENQDRSFKAFCDGPLRDYFLSQRHYELTDEWPFGEREHGIEGVFAGCASVLAIEPDPHKVINHLLLLQRPNFKGHWPCPCGSGQIIRKCHGQTIFEMREKISPEMATRMLARIWSLTP